MRDSRRGVVSAWLPLEADRALKHNKGTGRNAAKETTAESGRMDENLLSS